MRAVLVSCLFLLLAGCASTTYRAADRAPAAVPVETPVAGCAANEAAFDCDRRAILAMQGEFKVGFHFDETAVLAPGYERRKPQRSGAFETVVLIEDRGEQIELQHLLVVGDGQVVKHWRQLWVHEAQPRWGFLGDQRFGPAPTTAPVPAASGEWTQYVYEVSDAPRYTGSGRWNHRYGVSTWTSNRSWRPLPRREYTTRDDYDLINAENRHTITPQGWTHEQDNTKVRRRGGKDEVLVRESGFNDYRRIKGHAFAPAYRYWEQTGAFWSAVRKRWDAALASPEGLRLGYPVDDEAAIMAMFAAADAYAASADLALAQQSLDAWFAKSVTRATETTAATP